MTELKCEVPLQNLLHRTVTRLMTYLKLQFENKQLLLILKYGFDGTNGTNYKQKASDSKAYSCSVFCSSLVPLKLVDKNTGIVYWENQSFIHSILPTDKNFIRKRDGQSLSTRRGIYQGADRYVARYLC